MIQAPDSKSLFNLPGFNYYLDLAFENQLFYIHELGRPLICVVGAFFYHKILGRVGSL